jgi:hypothetical protein
MFLTANVNSQLQLLKRRLQLDNIEKPLAEQPLPKRKRIETELDKENTEEESSDHETDGDL